MGWGDCGKDSKGRNIGYVWEATCDHKGCNEKIDRGLAYACGGMHGENVDGGINCENYFCGKHLKNSVTIDGCWVSVCEKCYNDCIKYGWDEDEEVWKDV